METATYETTPIRFVNPLLKHDKQKQRTIRPSFRKPNSIATMACGGSLHEPIKCHNVAASILQSGPRIAIPRPTISCPPSWRHIVE